MHHVHEDLRMLGYLVVGGLGLLMPDDHEAASRRVMLWLMTTVWVLLEFDIFLERPDRLPLLLVQLLTVLIFAGSLIVFYANREDKAKQRTWRYTVWMSGASLLVLSFIHLFEELIDS